MMNLKFLFIFLLLLPGVTALECGNQVCEIGENVYNCPDDCAYSPIDFKIDLFDLPIELGSYLTNNITITNEINRSMQVRIAASGDLQSYVFFSNDTFTLRPLEERVIQYTIDVPELVSKPYLQGAITVFADGRPSLLPLTLLVVEANREPVQLDTVVLQSSLDEGETLQIASRITSSLTLNTTTIKYSIFRDDNRSLALQVNRTYENFTRDVLYDTISLPENFTQGTYLLTARVIYGDRSVQDSASFEIETIFWTALRIRIVLVFIGVLFLSGLAWYLYKRYMTWKKNNRRYLLPNFDLVPKKGGRNIPVGRIPNTTRKAFFDPDTLTTHALVTGSTGSGKSVTASVLIEEVLQMDIPVLVFDPTSQWTGFVKQLKDPNILKFYKQFGIPPEDARSYKGLLYDVDTPDIDLEIERYMNPGEVTVFNLSKLKTGEYDQAVMRIIDKLFHQPWDESPQLRMVLVFDECHRLLEKYGGKGGYVALEKACREFRKWGIGLVMVSQVNADFKEAVAGNILTEIQLNTKSIEDIKKIEQKYGADYATRITRQGIGVAMVQNPKYNDGQPWFVQFRPPYHDPHKISDDELQMYSKYSNELDALQEQVTDDDIKMELKLARDKLKGGHFKMVDIYLKTIKQRINKE